MNKALIILSVIVCFSACKNASEQQSTDNDSLKTKPEFFGTKIDEAGAVPVADFVKTMKGAKSENVKLSGTVKECCQEMGCWMDIEKGDGSVMKVAMKDHNFFIPKNSAGKTAIFQGVASLDTIPVEMLKHYAEDAGKPQTEIDAITQPSFELTFEAEGVILK